MKKLSERTIGSGKWLALKETVFENKHGELIKWESVERANRSSCVVIVPKLMPSNRFVLIKQYRPAIEGYILGFPAGIDNDSEEDIILELKEETGYTGTIANLSPFIKSGAGIINDRGRVVCMHIDEHASHNQNPIQDLDPSEDIEVVLLAREEIRDYLMHALKEGVSIGANLWYLFVVSEWVNE